MLCVPFFIAGVALVFASDLRREQSARLGWRFGSQNNKIAAWVIQRPAKG
jgi:hypothetical protein